MRKKDVEFKQLVNDYVTHPKVNEMKNYSHHGINRFDHSYRVAYHTFKITKLMHLNYKSATKAAMLHDFFLDEVQDENSIKKLRAHSNVAVNNSKKYFSINSMEEDIISKHMFPVTFVPPKYLEGWIVDIVDDYVSVYERFVSLSNVVKVNVNILFILSIFRFFM